MPLVAALTLRDVYKRQVAACEQGARVQRVARKRPTGIIPLPGLDLGQRLVDRAALDEGQHEIVSLQENTPLIGDDAAHFPQIGQRIGRPARHQQGRAPHFEGIGLGSVDRDELRQVNDRRLVVGFPVRGDRTHHQRIASLVRPGGRATHRTVGIGPGPVIGLQIVVLSV